MGELLSIRDLYEKTVSAELPDGSKITLARLTLRDWSKIAREIREERIAAELKAIGGVKDPIVQQTLRLRAEAFEPSYYELIDSATTTDGVLRVLPYAAIKGGTDKAIADELPDLLQPRQIQALMSQITHAPTGPKVGGDLTEGQPANPTEAESSPSPTGTSEPQHGSESQSISIGATSDGASDASMASSSTT